MGAMIKTKPLLINLLLTLVALFLHGYLTIKFYDLQSGAASGQSLCNLSSTWNCDVVSTSTYARFLGFPLALWALVVHLVFLAAQGTVFFQKNAQGYWAQITVWTSWVILAASVVMAAISITQLNTYCLFCTLAYALSVTNIVFLKWAGLGFRSALAQFPKLISNKTTWVLVAIVPMTTFVFNSGLGGEMASKRAQSHWGDMVAAWAAAPEQDFDLTLGLRLGSDPETAKITIIEFADFRCPHCKTAAGPLERFVKSRRDVALIFKPYPLDGTCNLAPAFQGSGDGISCRLAFAVQCSEKLQQNGWAMYDHIFEHQDDYRSYRNVADVEKRLCESGLIENCETFKACLSSDEVRTQVQSMAAEGTQAGIRGTPSFFVNKKALQGGQYPPVLERVEKLIKSQSN